MIFVRFFLFLPILVFAADPFILGRILTIRDDTYDIPRDGVLSETDYINADQFNNNADLKDQDYALFLDGTSILDDSDLVSSDCSSQRSGKLRSREECENPAAPKLELPSLDTAGISALQLKPRCEDGEERLCCAGEKVSFWDGFRAIVPNCAKSQSSIYSLRFHSRFFAFSLFRILVVRRRCFMTPLLIDVSMDDYL